MKSCLCSVLGYIALTAMAAGAEIGLQLNELLQADWLARDGKFAVEQPTTVTTADDARGGCDGVKNGRWGFHVASQQQDPWWQVDLGQATKLDRVVIFNRTDRGTAGRTRGIRILAADGPQPNRFEQVYQHDGKTFYGVEENKPLVVDFREKNVTARIVRLAVPGRCSLALDEVEVYAAEDPSKNIALGKPADQISTSPHSFPATMGEDTGVGFSLAHSREVIRRAKQLVGRLRGDADPQRLDPPRDELAKLDARLRGLEKENSTPLPLRRELYLRARRLLRQIAFCNPRLQSIDKLLFIKRHDPGGVFHMCDQYYGCNATPGGGLFVLQDPFGPNPKLIDLLENSLVENGRLKGQKLAGGSFLSPEVSYDGKTILFAYSQAKAYAKYRGKEAYEWGPEISYHIFEVDADGTGLVQLTDGVTDDFDPCFLPGGRILFISQRRGGYLRCGRHCPVYTMFSMENDGSDIVCVSFHETHEWQPSIGNDGMIVYSRWDYVDRDTNVAHHIWTCYPDGRNPRAFHGNYPKQRESRPWMEMSIRAIPDSPKYVATTGAHHGHAFGSLVLIDPRLADDGAMSQLTRLTPDVPFPESEGRPIRNYMAYGTAWPLSEDDYLCVFDAKAQNRGIYWIDGQGNRELIYRDPSISCLSPIPLQPRRMPPVIPERTIQTAAAREASPGLHPATVAVMNVYDSDFDWPQGTRIEALRVIQLLPKSTPPPNEPRIGVANQTNARAVLGTVPVEADGSAHFEAPPGVPIYFQALDAKGMAVQSMRSATYLHPGERLACQGCHERRHEPPNHPRETPLALRREPSKLQGDVDGSNPFNYPRLVQGALDRNCVGCHREKNALDLSGAIEGGFTRSYNNLAGKYGFYFHVGNGSINQGVHGGSRSIAGKFGARASELMKYLGQSHYGVQLSPEDFHRLTLWLDCNSEFYGSYENAPAQARGETVLPTLE